MLAITVTSLALQSITTPSNRQPSSLSRRALVAGAGGALLQAPQGAAALEDKVRMTGLNGPGKTKTFFSDYELSESGLQFKDFKPGAGPNPKTGDRVSLEWTGVTVGYQGRYFETRNKPKGGAFADDGFLQEPLAFSVGDGTVIPAIDEVCHACGPLSHHSNSALNSALRA